MANTPKLHEQRHDDILRRLRGVSERFNALAAEAPTIAQVAEKLIGCFRAGGKVMFCGNGGSAADSQHLATELMGRYMRDRRPLPAIALTVDTSALTAIANDYGFEHVFSRQVRGIGQRGDVLVGISTSGNSANVVNAFATAKELGILTVAFTGRGGGKLATLADLTLRVPSDQTNEIQEMHIVIGHMLCGYVEEAIC